LTKAELESKIKGLLGGRAAEDVALNEISTGASNDIQRATDIARKMVAMYGMSSELGLMAPATVSHAYLGGAAQLDCANETAATVDRAVQTMLSDLYRETTETLRQHSQLLEAVTQLLLEKESISGDEFMEIVKQYT
jgi:cell division protease FtsH